MANSLTGPGERDYDLSLTITGEVESLRPRLREALQTLGYTVLGDQPLYAKRGAQGGARWECSFEALDYPTRLTISLKQINNIAVVATFNYEIKTHACMTKGDRQTLAREAEAIAALASERHAMSACPACATPVTDDSHFCRRCGSPLVIDAPELEVLRLTRKTRTAYHNQFLGIVLFALAAFVLLSLIVVGPKAVTFVIGFASVLGLFGLLALLQGLWQLHFSLNPKPVEKAIRPHPTFDVGQTKALRPTPVHASVTEGTTELLRIDHANNDDNQELVVRQPLDTGEILNTAEPEDDRLM
jgi:hypothetical protein